MLLRRVALNVVPGIDGPRGVTAVALTPGFLRSEAMLEHFGVTEETWRALDPELRRLGWKPAKPYLPLASSNTTDPPLSLARGSQPLS